MKITTYRTLLDDDRLCTLVKESSTYYTKLKCITKPCELVQMMNDIFQTNRLDTEYIYMLSLNSKNVPIGIFEVSHGTVNSSLLSPREIILKALLLNTVNIVLVHNHPSGIAEPSDNDIQITKRITAACQLIGFSLIDHIIIGNEEFYSFKEHELIP